MQKLSTGEDSTLRNYRKVAVRLFGEESGAVKFLDTKIAKSPSGEDEEVLVEESQMVGVLMSMNRQ